MSSGQGKQDGAAPVDVAAELDALLAGAPGTVAVVDAADGAAGDGGRAVVVWHVQLDPAEAGGRLSGAWRIPLDDADAAAGSLRNLLTGCAILVAADDPAAGPAALGDLPAPVAAVLAERPVVDPAATADGVRRFMSLLRRAASAEKARREAEGLGRLTAPRLPAVADPAPVDVPYVGLEAAARALGWARGIEELLETWDEIDSQRRRREWLGGGPRAAARPMPLVMAPQEA
ncbi:hypothetical protein [Corynebacterium sp.]|uniref:hypothetical protein n=1 Tax=Corynebacterium sp. TaxID=1720 RepID=UPI0026DDCB10|nr:hypothetical protein [Corynebacterium sp.]MDO4609598.1 hypothetical protein [Corynebacterium sp.]